MYDKKRPDDKENPLNSRAISLSFVLSFIFITLTVVMTLSTAWSIYQNHDKTLVNEFRNRIKADAEQISLQIDNTLQSAHQQLTLLTLDNSVKVTLMLNVDVQLVERLDAHHETYKGAVHFIKKLSDNELIISNHSSENAGLIELFENKRNQDGQLFQDSNGNTYVGFTSPIQRRDKKLGIAGSIYQLNFDYILPTGKLAPSPKILLKKEQGDYIDLHTKALITVPDDQFLGAQKVELLDNNSNQLSGYLRGLQHYPNLYYFSPDNELNNALENGLNTVIIISFICIAAGGILAILLGRSISHSLSHLIQATKQIADGHSSVPDVPRSNIREIQEFTKSLLKILHTLKQDEERIIHQANYDSLTGLPNRNLFMDRISLAIESAERQNSTIALMFIDLDQFKTINDTMGHQAGDDLLNITAQRLKSSIRKSDTVARLGGDEFTILMPNINKIAEIETIINQLLELLSEHYLLQDYEAFISASIGVSVYPNDGKTADVLLSNADSAMYKAKEKGRNNAQFFTQEMNLHAIRRRQLESELRQAIEKEQLNVVFQPVYQTSTGKIVGAEALLRWRSETLGDISPVEFIPLAEDTGLILPIGEWVLKQACEAATRWNTLSGEPIYIAVNLSSRQFQRTDVYNLVLKTLTDTQLQPSRLTLEITESLLLEDGEDTLNTLHQFRKMGISVAIDDFGTGYSSLSYLKRFPVNIIKIDRSFIRDIPSDESDTALVQSILSISKTLGMKTIAEGVETKEQYQFLTTLHCEMVQGFYKSKPIDSVSLEKILAQEHVEIETI